MFYPTCLSLVNDPRLHPSTKFSLTVLFKTRLSTRYTYSITTNIVKKFIQIKEQLRIEIKDLVLTIVTSFFFQVSTFQKFTDPKTLFDPESFVLYLQQYSQIKKETYNVEKTLLTHYKNISLFFSIGSFI